MDIARASIKRRTVVLFLCALMALGGAAAYLGIGKLEDPAFTIKTAVVTVVYPGATALEVEREAASRMEDAVQAMGEVKRLRTRCAPGVATLYVDIKDTYTAEDLPQVWNVLRQKVYDAQASLPSGCSVVINNDFGDVFGQYYALTGDGFTMKELRDYADFLKKELVLVPGVARVSIQGEQSEAVYVEFSTSRLRSLGMSPSSIFSVLNEQNTISAMGRTFYGDQYVTVNPTGGILSVGDIGDVVIGGRNGRLIRLKEVAEVRRDYADPQTAMMFFNGRPALGLGIATVAGGTTPLSMLVIGASLGGVSLLDAFRNKQLYLASAVRLLLIPLVTWLVCGLMTQDPVLRSTMMIVAACPGAVMVTVMANQYDRDAVYTAEGTLQSTALSLVTIPFLVWLLAK